MAKIIFEGWEAGMKKISFVKLLNEKCGLSLRDSKILKDRLVNDNETIEIEVADLHLAETIVEESRKLKVTCKIK